jgi:phosphate transport system protein
MRDTFHRELEFLDEEIVRMGAMVERSTQQATTSLIEGDRELAERVKAGDNEIDDIFLDIEKRALTLLAQQAPVASDLRLVVAILRVCNDLERAGDLAYNIAKIAQQEDFSAPGLKAVRGIIAELGTAAADLTGAAIDAWASKDEHLAADIEVQDDKLDNLYACLLENLVELKGQKSLSPALRLVLVGRSFERIGDHAVALGDGVRYFVTGSEEHLG